MNNKDNQGGYGVSCDIRLNTYFSNSYYRRRKKIEYHKYGIQNPLKLD